MTKRYEIHTRCGAYVLYADLEEIDYDTAAFWIKDVNGNQHFFPYDNLVVVRELKDDRPNV